MAASRSLRLGLGRALRRRCPQCGGAPIFDGWWRMKDYCLACGHRFEREPGYWVGAVIFNTIIAIAQSFFPSESSSIFTWPDGSVDIAHNRHPRLDRARANRSIPLCPDALDGLRPLMSILLSQEKSRPGERGCGPSGRRWRCSPTAYASTIQLRTSLSTSDGIRRVGRRGAHCEAKTPRSAENVDRQDGVPTRHDRRASFFEERRRQSSSAPARRSESSPTARSPGQSRTPSPGWRRRSAGLLRSLPTKC